MFSGATCQDSEDAKEIYSHVQVQRREDMYLCVGNLFWFDMLLLDGYLKHCLFLFNKKSHMGYLFFEGDWESFCQV